ncbi:GNAT family N-acetyltransferase [Rhodococcus hoagii]|nr:GNAT family N-acetyltransferase [Prescottella equi]
MTITVRPFEPRDTEQARQIVFEDADKPDQIHDIGRNGETAFPFFVASDDGGVLHGIVEGHFNSEYAERLGVPDHKWPQGWIYTLAVRGESRRMGVGTALVQHFVEVAKGKGCTFVAFNVDESDDDASIAERTAFFRALGFDVLVDDDRGSAMGGKVDDILRGPQHERF